MANFVRPFSHAFPHLAEFVSFVDDVDSKCECDKMNLINRAINYYRKLPQVLTFEEINAILHKNNQNPIALMYQFHIFHIFENTQINITSTTLTNYKLSGI